MLRTRLTDRCGLSVPLVSAPMAGVAGGKLAAAVTAAGGLGTIGVGSATPPEWIVEQAQIAAADGGPYGIGLMGWAWQDDPAQLDAVLACDPLPALVSVSFSDPFTALAEPLRRLREATIVTATQVGTRADLAAALDLGVDVVVARGGEGGGHGRDLVATLPLLQLVLDDVAASDHDPLVLAAGGITGGRGLAAVLAAGADGAWVGTAFLTCAEAFGSEQVKERLIAADETATAYGTTYDVANGIGWPAAYGMRGLRTPFFEQWHGREDQLAADTEALAEWRAAGTGADPGRRSVAVGQAVGALRGRTTAADVVADLAGADDLLARWAPRGRGAAGP